MILQVNLIHPGKLGAQLYELIEQGDIQWIYIYIYQLDTLPHFRRIWKALNKWMNE